MPSARSRRLLLLILLVALLLRLAHWGVVREAPFIGQLVMDSEEYDRWGLEIAAGDWLGSEPFFQAPLYPYFLGSIYAVTGSGAARLDAVYLLQILLSVAGCYALFRAGLLLGGTRLGLAAATLGALYGPFLFYDVQLLKESLAVSTASFLLWALVAAARKVEPKLWLAAGVLLGVLILLRENTLLVVPLLLPVTLLAGRRSAWARAAALLGGIALVLAPVAVRNAAVGGGFLPTTFQGGINFYIGNNPEANGTYQPLVPGRQIPAYERREPVRLAEQSLGRELTPREVSDYWLGRSLAWARSQPLDFAALQFRKLGMFWRWYEWPDAVDYYHVASLSPALGPPLLEFGGIALLAALGLWLIRDRLRDWSPVLLFLVGWVASTVIFFVFSRYRLPAVPAMVLLGAVPLAAVAPGAERSRQTATLRALVLATLLLPHLGRPAPRDDLVHYNLGVLAARGGRAQDAAAHYATALAANPDLLSASLELGNLARERGDLAAARDWYARATRIEPRSALAWTNLGGAWMVLGQPQQAAAALQRAVMVDPSDLGALNTLAALRARRGDAAGARQLIDRILASDPTYAPALSLRQKLEENAAADAGRTQ